MLTSSAYALLIKTLLRAFPQSVNIDYFELCGIPTSDAFISTEKHDLFSSINSMLQMLETHKVVTLDRFNDGTDEFFWNVKVTLAGHGRLCRLEEASLSTISAQQIAACVLTNTN